MKQTVEQIVRNNEDLPGVSACFSRKIVQETGETKTLFRFTPFPLGETKSGRRLRTDDAEEYNWQNSAPLAYQKTSRLRRNIYSHIVVHRSALDFM